MNCEKSTSLVSVNYVARKDDLARFKVHKLLTLMGGKQAEQAKELMRRALFKQWLIDYP
jgi:hypothetical protein